MDITKLISDYNLLSDYLKKENYSSTYQHQIDNAYRFIVNDKSKDWESFDEIKNAYCTSKNENTNNARRTALNVIGKCYLYGEFPSGTSRNYIFAKKEEDMIPEYRNFYEYVSAHCSDNRLAESYNEKILAGLHEFLLYMQKNSTTSLEGITVEKIIDYFFKDHTHRSYDAANYIRHAFLTGIGWSKECRRIMSDIPKIRHRRKNIQYLTPEEVTALQETLDNESTNLTLCDRAVGCLLLYTGLRGCDIANLKLENIDWENERLEIIQSKTKTPLQIPLLPVVGNALFRYLTVERPNSEETYVFLTQNAPTRRYLSKTIETNSVNRILKAANIRQNPGDRKGSHIFRHNYTKSLLENNVSQPVITAMLGHNSPASIEAYLNTDFVHLKQCSLSIEDFPVSTEVFGDE